MKKYFLFLFTSVVLLNSALAEVARPYMFFDFGMTVVSTIEDPKTGDFPSIFYMPGALEYITELRKQGFHVGMLINVPETWGATDAERFETVKAYVAQRWTDARPMDWSLFDAGVLTPPKDHLRKPHPYLFEKVLNMARAQGAEAIFHGEDAEEIKIAKQVGLHAHSVTESSDFFIPIDKLPYGPKFECKRFYGGR